MWIIQFEFNIQGLFKTPQNRKFEALRNTLTPSMTSTLICELINTTILQHNTAISYDDPTIIKIPYPTNLRTPSPGKYSRLCSLQTKPGPPPPGARVQNLPSVRTRCAHPIAPAPNTLDAVRVRVQGASIGCSGCRCCQRCKRGRSRAQERQEQRRKEDVVAAHEGGKGESYHETKERPTQERKGHPIKEEKGKSST